MTVCVICSNLLNKQNIKSFWWKIITGNEKWIYYKNPKRRKHWVDVKPLVEQFIGVAQSSEHYAVVL